MNPRGLVIETLIYEDFLTEEEETDNIMGYPKYDILQIYKIVVYLLHIGVDKNEATLYSVIWKLLLK